MLQRLASDSSTETSRNSVCLVAEKRLSCKFRFIPDGDALIVSLVLVAAADAAGASRRFIGHPRERWLKSQKIFFFDIFSFVTQCSFTFSPSSMHQEGEFSFLGSRSKEIIA